MNLPRIDQPFVTGTTETSVGTVPIVSSRLNRVDWWGTVKARWGVGRMHYAVDPGLYAVGNPTAQSPVLVTANYKMSFDCLRGELGDRDAWILVLDTNGINVWCAAGKGTFGTAELARRIEISGLDRVVTHRRLIVPQLGAPGVAAHQVRELSGFRVVYGPIRARDLATFLDSGMKATPEMRRKTFTVQERAVLIPIELVDAFKGAFFIAGAFFVLGGFLGEGGFWTAAIHHGRGAALALLAAVLAGAVATPILLPWLPGRAFSAKGIVAGLAAAVAAVALQARFSMGGGGARELELLGWGLLALAATSHLALNFTGASTYTSLSGVRKEMRWSVPFQIAAAAAGLGSWLGSVLL